MNNPATIRPPAVAGLFYHSDPVALRRQVAQLLQQAKANKVGGKIRGVIVPHAGYVYSGFTAAHAYSMLREERFDVVVIVSPSHREYFKGVCVYCGDAYETPLGIVEVNTKLRDDLMAASDFSIASDRGHGAEHALEVQLPFLQEVLPAFTLLPIVIGDQRREFCVRLGETLATILKDQTALLVASTDLSHFHTADVAEKLDSVMMHDVGQFDALQLMSDLETGRTEACGGGPTVAVMTALKLLGVNTIKVLYYANSGDTTGDYGSVVGYLSAVAYERALPNGDKRAGTMPLPRHT